METGSGLAAKTLADLKVVSAKSMFCNSVAKTKCTLVCFAFKTPGGRLEEYGGKKNGEGDQECKNIVHLLDKPRFGHKSLTLNPRPLVHSWGIIYLLP